MAGNRKGFTLVELIIASALLAVLAVVGLMVINPHTQFDKARDGRRKGDIKQIKTALQMYHNNEGEYPTALPSVGDEWTRPSHTDVVYMKSLPGDPNGTAYSYWTDPAETNPQDYCLWATLQHEEDPSIAESQTKCDAFCGSLYGAVGGVVVATDYVVCAD